MGRMKTMNNRQLVNQITGIFRNYKTVYMWGVFGAPVTQALITQKAKQYPKFYTVKRQSELMKLIGKGYFGFDCVNIIKAILWGWNGDPDKKYGGATYTLNGVPDWDANKFMAVCSDQSLDFSHILPGEAVGMKGHIGIYIGDGKVAECTPSWANGVQITACLNIGPIAGLEGRKWTNHGRLPWVTYIVPDQIETLVSDVAEKLKLNSEGLWIKALKGERTPTPQEMKALFEKILKEE